MFNSESRPLSSFESERQEQSQASLRPTLPTDTLIPEENYPPPTPEPQAAATTASQLELKVEVTRLRLIAPKNRPKEIEKPWHDMRLFTSHTASTTVDVAAAVDFQTRSSTLPMTGVENYKAGSETEDAPPSATARRLSLIPEVAGVQVQETYPVADRRRRKSLTPLSYFGQFDGVEQYVEQAAVTAEEELPEELQQQPDCDEQETYVPLDERFSAEHFKLPRQSICAGIKIEITPPSAIREGNNFILNTVIIEVPDDDSPSSIDMPDANSHVVNVQQLARSSVDLRTITPVRSVASVTRNPSPEQTLPTNTAPPPYEAAPLALDRADSVVMTAPPVRRRTKLIAINVRRQTLSAVPRTPKTVRFAPSPTRSIEYMIDETESLMPDRHPHMWTEELAGRMETAEQLETESEKPFIPGLLRVYDFSRRELQHLPGGGQFVNERSALVKFFAARLVNVPSAHLDALKHPLATTVTGVRSTTDKEIPMSPA
ncbi:hypothetical protein BV898_11613 [Hypsibius exemplaris]|uniref:Uncharacterized protein n=1 Tax=Hypsibius exemplaris TaxID=2072580 RepID=A0A1W0WG20_HYPEX|nr:hypothetical protein BV898_11613 [Hypsibius exemplaris]